FISPPHHTIFFVLLLLPSAGCERIAIVPRGTLWAANCDLQLMKYTYSGDSSGKCLKAIKIKMGLVVADI
ncbi:hypothetical protein NL517_30340, partial [Klebsiella pneumoniae]|nr:hypothetical protein [Klebsiella pneumoniae]